LLDQIGDRGMQAYQILEQVKPEWHAEREKTGRRDETCSGRRLEATGFTEGQICRSLPVRESRTRAKSARHLGLGSARLPHLFCFGL